MRCALWFCVLAILTTVSSHTSQVQDTESVIVNDSNITDGSSETEKTVRILNKDNSTSNDTTSVAEFGTTDSEPLNRSKITGLKGGGESFRMGVHYNYENGKLFINCAKRETVRKCDVDGTNCRHEVIEGPKTTKCYLSSDKTREQLGCITVFEYKGTVNDSYSQDVPYLRSLLEPRMKGCWQHEPEVHEECTIHNEKCFIRIRPENSQQHVFCCCNSHLCNVDFEVEPYSGETDSDEDDVFPGQADGSWSWYQVVSIFSVAIFVVAVLIGSIVGCKTMYQWRQRVKRSYEIVLPGGGGAGGDQLALLPTTMNHNSDPWWIDDSKIHLENVLASGRFAEVYFAQWMKEPGEKPIDVVVKIVAKQDQALFRNERDMYHYLGAVERPGLSGYCGWTEHYGRSWIIMPYFSKGSLHDVLQAGTLTLQDALRVISSMLDGLSYLHEEKIIGGIHKPTIVHRDIKSRNVLLKTDARGELTSCIADFGLAMKIENIHLLSKESHGQVGTRRYMAPEVLEGATEFTATAFRQVDVYCAALVMWEVVERSEIEPNEVVPEYQPPYEAEGKAKNYCPFTLGTVRQLVAVEKVRPGFRPAVYANSTTAQIAETCEEMWDHEADGRITVGCALDRIRVLSGEVSEGYCSVVEPIESDVNDHPSSSSSDGLIHGGTSPQGSAGSGVSTATVVSGSHMSDNTTIAVPIDVRDGLEMADSARSTNMAHNTVNGTRLYQGTVEMA